MTKPLTNRIFRILSCLALAAAVYSCATQGSPSGGRSDYDAPVPQLFLPENYTTNFKEKKIEVVFDERIKYKDLQKQFVSSPPIQNLVMRIKPSPSTPSRKMEIDLSGIELLPNTTYTLNFGNSVADNHEGTSIPNFKYVFSTGPKIDSLVVGGVIEDAFTGKFDPKTVVMLYRVDSTFNDSTIFKEKPMYFSRLAVEKDSTFRIENIAPGTYQLVALLDEANNMVYDQSKDQIAFFPRYLELKEPSPQGYLLRPALARRAYKVYQGINVQKGLIQVAIDGLEPGDSVHRIQPALSDTAREYYLFNPAHDTLRYWFTDDVKDSILLKVTKAGHKPDTVNAKIRKPAAVDFARRVATRELALDGHVVIEATKPIGAIDPEAILLLDKDSIAQPFVLELDSSTYTSVRMLFRVKPENQYRISIFPQALQSILGEIPKDTAKASLKTLTPDDYGTVIVNPISLLSGPFPLIFQLITLDGKTVVREAVLREEGKVTFPLMPAGKYRLRVIYDTNGNGRWDTADYLKRLQPERVKYFPDEIQARALWESPVDW